MPGLVHVSTTINGNPMDFLCEPRQSLLECLRDVIGMTGSITTDVADEDKFIHSRYSASPMVMVNF